jgi:hypothetical protein
VPDLTALTQPAAPRSAAAATATGLVEAVIATSPASINDDVYVVIGNAEQRSGPCEWLPRGDMLPERGQRCYVQQSNLGTLVLVQWGIGVPEPEPPDPRGLPATTVTALPGSPTLGQSCWFQTAGMAALAVPVSWLLVYDGAKWVPFGATPILAEQPASVSTTSLTYTLTSGPDIGVPAIGVYKVATGARMHNSSAGCQAIMSYAIGATAAVDGDNMDNYNGSAHTVAANYARSMTKTLAAVTLASRYRAGVAGTAFFEKRWMELTPLRLG